MNRNFSRRELLKGSVAFAAVAFTNYPLSLFGFSDEEGELIPFLDVQPAGRPMLRWQELDSWITPNEKVFAVSHYGQPEVDPEAWRLNIGGLVKKPISLTFDDIKSRPRKDVIATLECSGNSSNPGFMGAIGNVKWTGTPLAPLLRECRLLDRAIEIVFYGADEKMETIRGGEYLQNFARSLARQDALSEEVLLAYEMNGEPLTKEHGAPVRLVVPGWFGIAWIKWLTRIEALDRRFMGKYMAREYVTLRGEEIDGRTVWRETSVGPIDVKSIIARAIRRDGGAVRFQGAAWTDGTPLKSVEVKIDEGPWKAARIQNERNAKYAWRFFTFDWKQPTPGEHKVVSRAIDAAGRIQPSAEDPEIKLKRTYWEASQQYPRTIRIEG